MTKLECSVKTVCTMQITAAARQPLPWMGTRQWILSRHAVQALTRTRAEGSQTCLRLLRPGWILPAMLSNAFTMRSTAVLLSALTSAGTGPANARRPGAIHLRQNKTGIGCGLRPPYRKDTVWRPQFSSLEIKSPM